jgi:hypothetical protein
MFKQKIFIASFFTLVLVAVLNYFGSKFYWYWTYKWFDIPMHILGGLWISLISLSLYSYFYNNVSIVNYKIKVLGVVLFAVLFIGISWEIFELVGGITYFTDKGYWIDTVADLINDTIGGLIAYLFFIKKRKCLTSLDCNKL